MRGEKKNKEQGAGSGERSTDSPVYGSLLSYRTHCSEAFDRKRGLRFGSQVILAGVDEEILLPGVLVIVKLLVSTAGGHE